MTSNMTTPEYQALDKAWSPKLSAAYDEIRFNPALFARIKAVYDARNTSGLDAKQVRLATRTYEGFVRNGAALDATQKAQLGQYNEQLASLFSDFSEKVLADESTYLAVTEAEMKGVPADVKAAAAAAAKAQGKTGYAIKNTRSAVDPVLTFADNRALREKVFKAFVNRGDNGDRERHQRDHRQDRQVARRPRQIARLRQPRRMADAGHDGQDPGQGDGPDDARVARGESARRRGSARHAGAGRQVGRAAEDRAVGLSLLHGEGAPAALQSEPGRHQAALRTVEHDQRHVLGGGRIVRPRLQGKYRRGAGVPPRRAHLRSPRPQGQWRGHRPVLHGQLCPRREAFGRVGDDLSRPFGPARQQVGAGVEQ